MNQPQQGWPDAMRASSAPLSDDLWAQPAPAARGLHTPLRAPSLGLTPVSSSSSLHGPAAGNANLGFSDGFERSAFDAPVQGAARAPEAQVEQCTHACMCMCTHILLM